MKNKPQYILFILLACFQLLLACQQKPVQELKKEDENKKLQEALIKSNQKFFITENKDIQAYIERKQWKMLETGSGLRYFIYKKGNGKKAEPEMKAKINYHIEFLTGYGCYSSDIDGPLEFVIGRAQVIAGLEEGILLLHEGDKAKFIIPSYLAHGLLGDGNRIPPRAALVYDVELIQLNN